MARLRPATFSSDERTPFIPRLVISLNCGLRHTRAPWTPAMGKNTSGTLDPPSDAPSRHASGPS
eukprot:11103879-Lingulodinium_polyedra.AAC.1